jgi:hypothetical protein
MGRKPIPRKQRAQPISFSLKPHIIEKIDDYSHDLKFSRSKFLEEAVTRYMLATDMKMIEQEREDRRLSSSTHDMTPDQKVAMALAAIQKANRDGYTISKSIMDNLRRELEPSQSKILDNQPTSQEHHRNYAEEFDTDREVSNIVYKLFKVYDNRQDAQREVSFHHKTHFARAMKVLGGPYKGQWGAYVSRVAKGE